jgi:hypothetical protein
MSATSPGTGISLLVSLAVTVGLLLVMSAVLGLAWVLTR